MTVKPLTPNVSVAPQMAVEEFTELAAEGYRSVISNRPDGESEDQPEWAQVFAAARNNGMEARHIPVVVNAIGDDDIERFRQALEEMPKPILAFCRTGTRAALLWALANDGALTTDERIRIAGGAGYDLKPFRERLDAGASR